MSKCPICFEDVKPRGANKAHPFCSARCKSIDLGKWLNEDYRVPVPGDGNGNEDDGEPSDGRALSSGDVRH